MRTLFSLLLLSLVFWSCQHSKAKEEPKKILSDTKKIEKITEHIEETLSYDREKVILLSQIRRIPFDTLNFILRDYYVATDTVSSFDKNSKYLYQSAIVKIANTYKITKSKIASLIFSYKYEMLTKEDIEESAIENFKDNYEEEAPEPEDPY